MKISMTAGDYLSRIGNPLIKLILRSPLHHLLDDQTALILYTGRKSGKLFTMPVNYHREGEVLRIVLLRNSNWWQNLRGGAAVKMIVKGVERSAWVDLIEDQNQVADQLNMICNSSLAYANQLNLQKDEHDDFVREDMMRAAQESIVLIVKLN